MDAHKIYERLLTVWKGREKEPAIIDGEKILSFDELTKKIEDYRKRLPENSRIGMRMAHGADQIAAIFAILANNSSYVPVEPFFPPNRIRFIMDDAEVQAVLVGDLIKMIGEAPEERPQEAYILYTSGSTGLPKGVRVSPENLLHYADAFNDEFYPGPSDRMLQLSVCTFDIFVEEVFGSLLNGACLLIPSEEDQESTVSILDYASRHHATMLSGFPYLLEEINRIGKVPKDFRLLISGGDVLRESYIDLIKDQCVIYNTYGPSETTVCATYERVDQEEALSDGTYPIGHPVLGTQVRILDERCQPVGAGHIGEIVIFGDGVSLGYGKNRPVENQAFVELDGKRAYISGDLGYELEDGKIAFIGRKDDQVMILGKRVEPTEVESVLTKIDEIQRACVLTEQDDNHLFHLHAFLELESDLPEQKIREALKGYLPDYMIPEYISTIANLPLTENGKVDRKKLRSLK